MWGYSYRVDGVDLVDNNGPCQAVIVDDERSADLRGHDRDVAWREGQYHTPNKRRTGVDIPLRLIIRDRNADNTVTHPDGKIGHAQSNVQEVKALLAPGQHILTRTAPHVGDQQTDVERIPGLGRAGDTLVYLAICHATFPFWRELPPVSFTESGINAAAATLEVTVAGDVAVPDATITITAGSQPVTNARIEIPSTGRYIHITDTVAAGESVVIDCRTKTATHSSDGIWDRALLRGFADFFILPRGTYDLDITCDAGTLDFDVTVDFHSLRET
jgi:hypothetical protein